ncbi:MAG: hypothetical protein M3065_00745 [Actinomycetota bacterium]|nr:hypothetical protein [Actinomycetota bacterium]
MGFFHFEQLWAAVLELEGEIAADTWLGEADRSRSVLSGALLGPPLVGSVLPAPVLVQCAWVRSRRRDELLEAVRALALHRPEDFSVAASFVLATNVEIPFGFAREVAAMLGPVKVRVRVLGQRELAARVDARTELRRAMPSVLGLRDLDDLIPPEVSARSSLDGEAARGLASVFVPTAAYRRALEVLDAHRFAVLTGPPEMGKTAIARMIGLAQMTAGWEAHECVRPQDVWRALDRDRAQVFVADDAFGSTEYRPDAAERWALEMERILRSLDDRHWLIWTSRPAPLRAGLGRLHRERGVERFPSPGEVLVDASELDPGEKTLILFRHAKAADLPLATRDAIRQHGPEIVAHPHFTPERIRRFVAGLKALPAGPLGLAGIVGSELATATDAMATSFSALSDEHRDLLIAMLDAPPGPVTERDLVGALRRHHDGALARPPAELVDRLTDHFLRVLA